ncbi:MAG: beta-ketoacyl synthase N-terminal-like domain-containing protein, partial [Gemmatimonadaceae bacterium]
MWAGLQAGKSAVRPITFFDASIYRSRIAAEIDFDPNDFLEERRVKRLDRFSQFVVTGARLAIEDSRINLAAEDRERIGSSMGTALGGVGYAEDQFRIFA